MDLWVVFEGYPG